eukprot:gene5221-4284_t
MDAARMGTLHAATLNQLVERITKVVVKPHQATPREVRAADEQFHLSFLPTYKLFCPPHVLLAKLFQRWFVPLGLPFTDTYSNHYIIIRTTTHHQGGEGHMSTKPSNAYCD